MILITNARLNLIYFSQTNVYDIATVMIPINCKAVDEVENIRRPLTFTFLLCFCFVQY